MKAQGSEIGRHSRIAGLRRIAYQAVIVFSKRNIKTFDTPEAAKDWLVTQA